MAAPLKHRRRRVQVLDGLELWRTFHERVRDRRDRLHWRLGRRPLTRQGYEVRGLTRSHAGAEALEAVGIRPVRGALADWGLLIDEARAADAVINAADADDAFAVSALLTALEGSGKPLVHTSGSSVVGDMVAGERPGPVYTEDAHVRPRFEKAARVAVDREVLSAAARGVRAVVICPTMVYGEGLGPKKESIQVPWLIELAKEGGVARHVGQGQNIWSHVHVRDLAELYQLALARNLAGAFFFAEQGEARLRDIAAAIGRTLGLGGRTEPLPLDEATRRWGSEAADYAFGSNSRVTAEKARRTLGWAPGRMGLIEEIESGHYARVHAPRQAAR